MKKIKSLQMHQSIEINKFISARRVQGGLIYRTLSSDGVAICFVPFRDFDVSDTRLMVDEEA